MAECLYFITDYIDLMRKAEKSCFTDQIFVVKQ